MHIKLERLKRFDPAKHDQLEGLLQWCQLMGLTGKDLVSLGGHIDRMQARAEVDRNRAILLGIKVDPVGSDRDTDERWTIKTAQGRYLFEHGSFNGEFVVTSYKTKVKKRMKIQHYYEVGKQHWRRRQKQQILLNYHYGHILLDF